MVRPSTTWLSSERPLYAATVRVVRLLAAAIVHSVSPGCTTCATSADAVAGAAQARAMAMDAERVRRLGRTGGGPPRGPAGLATDSPISFAGEPRARAYGDLQRRAHRHTATGGRRSPEAVGPEVAPLRTGLAALEPRPAAS